MPLEELPNLLATSKKDTFSSLYHFSIVIFLEHSTGLNPTNTLALNLRSDNE